MRGLTGKAQDMAVWMERLCDGHRGNGRGIWV